VNGIITESQGRNVSAVLQFPHISELSFQTHAGVLGVVSIVLFVGRTILSIFFTLRILLFFSRKGAEISADLISRLLAQSLVIVQGKTTQEMLYALTQGVDFITLNILTTAMVLVGDIALLVILGGGLLFMDATTVIGSFVVFVFVGLFLYRLIHVKVSLLGTNSANLSFRSNDEIVKVLGSHREMVVQNRRDYRSREIGKLRHNLAETSAELNFMPYISKYVIENAMIAGGF
jgi:ATP-binding cassette subfamily C protein